MNRLAEAGKWFFATSVVAFGIQQFIYKGFVVGLTITPEWIPGHAFWSYATGIVLIAAGVAIAIHENSRLASAVLAALFLLCILLIHMSRAAAIVQDLRERTRAFETLAMFAGALIVAGTIQDARPSFTGKGSLIHKVAELGRLLFAICMVVFGYTHFVIAGFIATLIPSWMPVHLVLAYFTGAGMIAAEWNSAFVALAMAGFSFVLAGIPAESSDANRV